MELVSSAICSSAMLICGTALIIFGSVVNGNGGSVMFLAGLLLTATGSYGCLRVMGIKAYAAQRDWPAGDASPRPQ